MLIDFDTKDGKEMYEKIWDRVYDELGFKPSYEYHGHSMNVTLPFDIKQRYVVYSTDDMNEAQTEGLSRIMSSVLAELTPVGKRVYALDWHHAAFLFDPRNSDEMKSVPEIDEKTGEQLGISYFPEFYPNGDYYFFIAEDFSFGWLGHPWRQEIWLYGDTFIEHFDRLYKQFNMKRIFESNGGN